MVRPYELVVRIELAQLGEEVALDDVGEGVRVFLLLQSFPLSAGLGGEEREERTERISCLRSERDGLVVTVRVSWEELERGARALEAVDQSEPWGES